MTPYNKRWLPHYFKAILQHKTQVKLFLFYNQSLNMYAFHGFHEFLLPLFVTSTMILCDEEYFFLTFMFLIFPINQT
jgi:hypothetical protein